MSFAFAVKSTLNYLILFVYLQIPAGHCFDLKTFRNGTHSLTAFPNRCVKNIITDNYPCGTTITVVYTQEEEGHVDSVIKRLNEELCYNILTRNFDQQLHIVIVNELYIVVAQDLQEFSTELVKLTKDALWNPKAGYIIHIHDIPYVDDVFKLLSNHNIFNAAMLHNERNMETVIYTYYPFADNSCGNNVDAVMLGKCSEKVTVSFTNKIQDSNRNKSIPCKIRIVANENVPVVIEPGNEVFQAHNKTMLGIEQYILDIISKDKNFVLEYTYVPRNIGFGNVLENGTSTGLLKYLETKEADLAMSGLLLTIKRGTPYDYIHGHSYSGFYFVVAAAREYDWAIVYREFHLITWVLIAAFFLIVSVICFIYKSLFSNGAQDNIGTMVRLWGYFFANTNQNMSNNKRFRKILACWIWFTFFTSNFYTTAFYSLMTVKVPPQNIRTDIPPVELYKSCAPINSRIFFKSTFNTSFPDNTEEKCENLDTFLNVCASDREFFCLVLKLEYLFEKWKYLDDDGNYKLEAWEYTAMTTTQGMFVPKGYVFKEILQKHANILLEAGLLQYQEKILSLKVNKVAAAKTKMFKMLELSAFRVAFYVLVFGEIVAIICFVGEHIKYFCTKNTHVRNKDSDSQKYKEKYEKQMPCKMWCCTKQGIYHLIDTAKRRPKDPIIPYID